MQVVPTSDYATEVCAALTSANVWANLPTDDKFVTRAVLDVLRNRLGGTGGSGTDLDPTKLTLRPVRPAELNNVTKEMAKAYAEAGLGNITITFLGENHKSSADATRASGFLDYQRNGAMQPGLVIIERGMKYDVKELPVQREDAMTTSRNAPGQFLFDPTNPGMWGFGLTAAQRSIVVAGYVLLCLGSGSQTNSDRVAIVFGENHQDMMNTHFEYLIKNAGLRGLAQRKRTYLTVLSLGK
jgi:hypothetical protein